MVGKQEVIESNRHTLDENHSKDLSTNSREHHIRPKFSTTLGLLGVVSSPLPGWRYPDRL